MKLFLTPNGKESIAKTILQLQAQPDSLNHSQYVVTTKPNGQSFILTQMHELVEARARAHECDTVCCVGGWVAFFGQLPEITHFSIQDAALYVLFGWEQRVHPTYCFPLFYPQYWHHLAQWENTADESAENVARNLQRILNDGFIEAEITSLII